MNTSKKQPITVLWLDDMREPYRYLSQKVKNPSDTLVNNLAFYSNFMKKYDPKFIWVRTFEEFVNYIYENGLPDFISFDHDLGKGLKKGAECAQWLRNYCSENNLPIPNFYAHSANRNGREQINAALSENIIRLNEGDIKHMVRDVISLLTEDVYVSDLKKKQGKNIANLTYKHGKRYGSASSDFLGTDKMDRLGKDTIEVPLKGGITSYNITSINGTEVMHYFKRYFENKKTELSVKDKEGNTETYELEMQKNEFDDFMRTFISKVNSVVTYAVNEFVSKENDFQPEKITIYPVKSSSNFNVEMANELAQRLPNIAGTNDIQVLNTNLMKKDLMNLERDEDFISKNKEYYDSKATKYGDNNGTNNQYLNAALSKLNGYKKAVKLVDRLSELAQKMITLKNNRALYKDSNTYAKKMTEHYINYCDTLSSISEESNYYDEYTGKMSKTNMSSIMQIIKYAKGPSIDNRTTYIWDTVKPFLRGIKSPVTGKPYTKTDVNIWKPVPFQIKNYANNVRMGLRNYYGVDPDIVKQESDKIKNSIIVVFDDNISGGATLADICLQFKQLGIKHLIPITFGVMEQKWSFGPGMQFNRPKGGFNTEFEYLN